MRLIVFAFSDNLSAENYKLSAESELPGLPLLESMWSGFLIHEENYQERVGLGLVHILILFTFQPEFCTIIRCPVFNVLWMTFDNMMIVI